MSHLSAIETTNPAADSPTIEAAKYTAHKATSDETLDAADTATAHASIDATIVTAVYAAILSARWATYLRPY
jgi:uncharacterized MnhB-related membrane protein